MTFAKARRTIEGATDAFCKYYQIDELAVAVMQNSCGYRSGSGGGHWITFYNISISFYISRPQKTRQTGKSSKNITLNELCIKSVTNMGTIVSSNEEVEAKFL